MNTGTKHSRETVRKMKENHVGMTGRKHSPETLEKMSKSQRGHKTSLIARQRQSISAKKRKPISEETRLKMRLSHSGSRHWAYGKSPSEDTLKKMRESHLGKKLPKEQIEKIRIANTNPSKERREKIGAAARGRRASLITKKLLRTSKLGKLNPQWKDGRTSIAQSVRHLPQMFEWTRNVLIADDYTCRKCFQIGGKLEADHIEMFSKIMDRNNIKTVDEAINCLELWQISNGQALCKACHAIKTQKDMSKPK